MVFSVKSGWTGNECTIFMVSCFVYLYVASFVFKEVLMGLLNKYIAMASVKNGLALSWQEMAAEKAI